MAATVQAIVFDFDGVLANSEPLHLRVYQEVLAESGIELTERVYRERYLGMDDLGVFEAVAKDCGLLVGEEEIELLVAEKARRFEASAARGAVMFPGAAACVRRLAAVWPVGVASGARRSEIELLLRRDGLLDVFRFIVAAGDTDHSKPSPEPYLYAADLHGVAPQACLAIEDSLAGLESARTAGCRTIGVTHTYPKAALAGHADLVVESLDAITIEALIP